MITKFAQLSVFALLASALLATGLLAAPTSQSDSTAGSPRAQFLTDYISYTAGQNSVSVEWTAPREANTISKTPQPPTYDFRYSPFTYYGGQACGSVELLVVSIHQD